MLYLYLSVGEANMDTDDLFDYIIVRKYAKYEPIVTINAEEARP